MFCFLSVLAAGSLAAQSYVVTGTVASATNGRQIPRARVLLRNLDAQAASTWGRADDSGRFSIKDVAAGTYIVSAEKPGFFTDKRIAAREAVVEIPSNNNLLVRLMPFSVVTGQVVDDHSEPLRNVDIRLLKWEYSRGHRYITAKASGVTDDRGEFRIGSVLPGRYFVMAHANLRGEWTRFFAETNQAPNPDTAYPPVFFPDTTDFREAREVLARAGDEAAVDFLFSPAPAVAVRGKVINGLTGRPVAGPSVIAQWAQFSGVMEPITVKADADGHFELWGLAPGSYSLATTFPEDGESYSTEIPVEVGRAGTNGVELAALPNFDVVGRITLNDTLKELNKGVSAEFIASNGKSLSILAVDQPARRGARPDAKDDAKVDSINDGRHEIRLIGKLRPEMSYRVRMVNLPADCYLQSVLVGGREVSPDDVMIRARRTEIEFVINAMGGQVNGTVYDSKNQPINGSTVLLAPDTAEINPDTLLRTKSDAKGQFSFHGVPPGSYKFLAWEDLDFDQLMAQPEALPSLLGSQPTLKVDQGGSYTVFPKLAPADSTP